jgi:hypothetical protein
VDFGPTIFYQSSDSRTVNIRSLNIIPQVPKAFYFLFSILFLLYFILDNYDLS